MRAIPAQVAQEPDTSITAPLLRKPAAAAVCARLRANSGEALSSTLPQESQIRKTTGSACAWRRPQATKALREASR